MFTPPLKTQKVDFKIEYDYKCAATELRASARSLDDTMRKFAKTRTPYQIYEELSALITDPGLEALAFASTIHVATLKRPEAANVGDLVPPRCPCCTAFVDAETMLCVSCPDDPFVLSHLISLGLEPLLNMDLPERYLALEGLAIANRPTMIDIIPALRSTRALLFLRALHRVVPQGHGLPIDMFDFLFKHLASIDGELGSVLRQGAAIAIAAFSAFATGCSGVLNVLLDTAVDFLSVFFAVQDTAKVIADMRDCAMFVLKTFMRYILSPTSSEFVRHVLVDLTIGGVTKFGAYVTPLILALITSVVGHADTALTYFISMVILAGEFITGFTLPTTAALHVTAVFNLVQKIIPSDLEETIAKIPYLGSFFSTDPMERLKEQYPGTFSYIQSYADRCAPQPLWKQRVHRKYARAYLAERSMMTLDAKTLLDRSFPKELALATVSDNLPQERHEAPCYVFYGKPGQGKSVTLQKLQEVLRLVYIELELASPETTHADFSYSPNANCQHFDGYNHQPVILLDDFLQSSIVPGNNTAEILLRLCNTAPFLLPMAHLENKGMYADPDCVLVSTNVPHETWRTVIPSNDVGAYDRRITFWIEVKKREPGPFNAVGDDQSEYILKTNGETHHLDFYTLIELIVHDLLQRKNAPSPGTNLDFNTRDKIQQLVAAKSWLNPPRELFPKPPLLVKPQGNPLVDGPCRRMFDDLALFYRTFFPDSTLTNVTDPNTYFRSDEAEHSKMCGGQKSELCSKCLQEKHHFYTVHNRRDGARGPSVATIDMRNIVHSPPWGCRLLMTKGDDPGQYFLLPARTYTTGKFLAMVLGATAIFALARLYKSRSDVAVVPASPIQVGATTYNPVVGAVGTERVTLFLPEEDEKQYVAPDVRHPMTQNLTRQVVSFGQRLTNQLPSVLASTFRLTDQNERLIGHAFALNSTDLLLPAHIWHLLPDKFLATSLAESGASSTIELKSHFFTSEHDTLDLILIRGRVRANCRHHMNKFSILAPRSIGGRVLRVDNVNEIVPVGSCQRISYTSATKDFEYEAIKVLNLPSEGGQCGLPYLFVSDSVVSPIVGLHTAGLLGDAFFVPVNQTLITQLAEALAGVTHYTLPSTAAVPQAAKWAEGVPLLVPSFETVNTIKLPSRTNLVPVGLAMDIPKECLVAPARLTPYYLEGKKVKPFAERMKKLVVTAERNLRTDTTVLPIVSDTVALILSKHVVGDWLPSYQEAVRSDPTRSWKSVDRSKSAGPRLRTTKNVFFTPDELPTLTDEALAHLEDVCEGWLEGDNYPFVRGWTLKDEKLPIGKATRIFSPDELTLYILSRRYFGSFTSFLSLNGKKFGIMANTTPEEVGHALNHPGSLVIPTDISSQEWSHTWIGWVEWFVMMIRVGIFSNDGPTPFHVHPLVPPVNKVNFLRFKILMSTVWSFFVEYKTAYSVNAGILGSGAFLTFGINAYRMLVVFVTALHYLFPDHSAEDLCSLFGTQFHLVDFGDDADSFCPPHCAQRFCAALSAAGRDLGHYLTGPDKTPNLVALPYDQSTFCGRQLTNSPIWGITAALELPRLYKPLQYVEKCVDTAFPDALLSVLLEATRHPSSVLDDFVEQIRWPNGSVLSAFVSADEIRRTAKAPTFREDLVLFVDSRHMRSAVRTVPTRTPLRVSPHGPEEKTEVSSGDSGNPLGDFTTPSGIATVVSTEDRVGNEMDWTVNSNRAFSHYPNLFSQRVLVAATPWLATDAPSTTLAFLPCPSSYFNAYPNAQMKLANHLLLRCTVHIEVVLLTQFQMCGALIVTGAPCTDPGADLYSLCSGPHDILSPGLASNLHYAVPFARDTSGCLVPAYKGTAQATDFDFVNIRVSVFSSLKPAGSQAAFQVTMWLEDVAMMGSAFTNFAISAQGHGHARFPPKSKKPNMVTEGIWEVTETLQATEGAVYEASGLVETLGGLADNVGKLAIKGAAASSALGLSKPNLLPNYVHTVQADSMFANTADGPFPGGTTGLFMDSRQIPPDKFYGMHPEREMMSAAILARKQLLSIISVSTVTPSGTVHMFPVTPISGRIVNEPNDISAGAPCYYASHFAFWRGDVIFELFAMKNSSQSLVFELYVDYAHSLNVISTVARNTTLTKVIWDTTVEPVKKICVPAYNPNEWYPNSFWEADPTLPVRGPVPYLFVRVVAPMVTLGPTSTSFDFAVFSSMRNGCVAVPYCSIDFDYNPDIPAGPAVLPNNSGQKVRDNPQRATRVVPHGPTPGFLLSGSPGKTVPFGPPVDNSIESTGRSMACYSPPSLKDVLLCAFLLDGVPRSTLPNCPIADYFVTVLRLFVFMTGGVRYITWIGMPWVWQDGVVGVNNPFGDSFEVAQRSPILGGRTTYWNDGPSSIAPECFTVPVIDEFPIRVINDATSRTRYAFKMYRDRYASQTVADDFFAFGAAYLKTFRREYLVSPGTRVTNYTLYVPPP